MSATTMELLFEGPYSWTGEDGVPAISSSEMGRYSGVYLWTVRFTEGELVYYVGQTGRSFSQRMLEHFREHMSGGYHLYEPQEFREGHKVLLWPGRYGPDRQPSLAKFLSQFSSFAPAIEELARTYRFYLASVDGGQRLRERIEGAIATHLYSQPGVVGEFQDVAIRYRPRWSDETPLEVVVRCSAKLIGVPEVMVV